MWSETMELHQARARHQGGPSRSANIQHPKRRREGTPVDLELAGETFEVERAGASETLGVSEQPRKRRPKCQGTTSDIGDAEEGVVFSERNTDIGFDTGITMIERVTQPSSAYASTTSHGNMGDYIPQAQTPLEVQTQTDMTGATAETEIDVQDDEEGDEDEDEDEEEEETQEQEEYQTARLVELDESQDQNDTLEETLDDVAQPAKWLTEAYEMTREPVRRSDRMSAFLESKRSRARARTVTAGSQDTEEREDEEDVEIEYHSGDSDMYEMQHRPVLERTAVKRDIRNLSENIKCLRYQDTGEYVYRIVDRLGEGRLALHCNTNDQAHSPRSTAHTMRSTITLTTDTGLESRTTYPVHISKMRAALCRSP